ncbi:protein kinase, putative, partial [Trypanosoma cruzi]
MENYIQIRVLGKGSFGSAWLVQRRSDKAQFVAKEVRLGGMKPAERESAKHEIEVLRTLNHPNITRYVDHYEKNGSLYIVMEYANGGDLYTKIRSRKGMRFREKGI